MDKIVSKKEQPLAKAVYTAFVTALIIAAALLLFPALFQTPEVAALENLTEELRLETSPVSDGERMELYDLVASRYLSAVGSVDAVLDEETEKLEASSEDLALSLLQAHQQRVRKGTQKIKRKKISAKAKRKQIQSMRKASYGKYLREQAALEQKTNNALDKLRDDHFDASEEVYDLQMRAMGYIDLRPSAEQP